MGKGGNKTIKWGKGETRGQNREGGNKTTTKILPKAVPRAAADSVRQLIMIDSNFFNKAINELSNVQGCSAILINADQ